MLKVQEIRELIKLLDQSSIDELNYEEDGRKIKLRKNKSTASQVVVPQSPVLEAPAAAPPVEVKEAPAKGIEKNETVKEVDEKKPGINVDDANLHQITSPMVGTFYSAPSPDESDYVKIGDTVSNDTIVCIVEAMKLFNEIEAEVDGEIVEVLVENGELVEYGQPLFLVKAAE